MIGGSKREPLLGIGSELETSGLYELEVRERWKRIRNELSVLVLLLLVALALLLVLPLLLLQELQMTEPRAPASMTCHQHYGPSSSSSSSCSSSSIVVPSARYSSGRKHLA